MLLCKTVLQIIFLVLVTNHIDAKNETKKHNKSNKNKREIERLGLYSDSQYVISLTVHTIKPAVYDKNYASLVEVSKYIIYCVFTLQNLSCYNNNNSEDPNFAKLDQTQ